MKNHVLLCVVILSLLVMSSQTTGVAENQSFSVASLDENQVPIVNSPLDIIYVEGSTGHSITWEIYDDNPAYWVTTRNGELLSGISWETLNETVTVDVDGLAAGNYEFKIYACDGIYNITDLVLVAVLSSDIEVHTPFSVSSNIQFNTTAQAEGWVGNGSATNPYIIEKLYIESSYHCISIHGTTVHFTIRNCTFVNSGSEYQIGVNLESVTNGIIANCTFANLWIGSITWWGSNCTWDSNIFGNLADGIWLNEATNCTIVENSFMSGGVSISGYNPSNWIHEISGNKIEEKPLGYFEGLSSIDIDAEDYGQVIVANCVGVDIFNGDFSNVGSAISIAHSNSSEIYNCEVQGGRNGIYLERTQDITIDTCQFRGSSEVGMYINETIQTTVYNCIIQDIGYVGVQVGMGMNTAIILTVIEYCGDVGIACYETPFFNVFNCTIRENNNGITMGGCPNSLIIGNKVQYNDEYGFCIYWDCDNCSIYANEFGYNVISNAYDDGADTHWDDGYSIGNIWSDYEGTGFYYVPGSGNGIDHYPGASEPVIIIEILDTADKSYVIGTTGHVIEWETVCTYPSMYFIFKDGVLQEDKIWNGSPISYNIDGLALGEYNFTLVILGEFGETASDTVIVTVIPDTPTIISSTTTSNTTLPIGLQEVTLAVSIGSIAVIVIVIVLIVRNKKGVV